MIQNHFNLPFKKRTFLLIICFVSSISTVPQQIFIPGLNINQNKPSQQFASQSRLNNNNNNNRNVEISKEKQNENTLPYGLDENQLNDLFHMINANTNNIKSNDDFIRSSSSFKQNEQQNKKLIPKPELLEQHDIDFEKYFNEAITQTSQNLSTPTTTTSTTPSTTTSTSTSTTTPTTTSTTQAFKQASFNSFLSQEIKNKDILVDTDFYSNSNSNQNPRISYGGNVGGGGGASSKLSVYNAKEITYSSSNGCHINRDSKYADELYCNLYHLCTNGVYQVLLCPEGYLYSSLSQKCESKSKVECGKRMALDFDRSNIPYMDYMNDYYNSAATPKIINGTLECSLGTDGYFADPEFCNIYHHCLAGVDYAEQCPHQLVWNDRKKMCDWQTSVNCTGRIIPVALGQTSFCTDKSDNKYGDSIYCNVFHHCVGGIDNVVRCDEELQWNDKDKKCDWESKVKCGGKMLPSEKHYNSTFCIGKSDGPYAHEEYCNVYHVCESGTDNIRQCPNQLFWDYKAKRCDWSGNVECTGRTLITLSTDTTLFCMERRDGVYGDPNWCNVYHNCLSGTDFKTKCPVGLIWNETKKDCDWSDSTQCSSGNFLKDSSDAEKYTFCGDKPNGKYPHEMHCNRYYVCQNGKDIIFTCQNNLRYNATKQECDWAVNVNCFGKQDYMWEGIKENFCKNKPDGNYPDPSYCNIFHQCQAATDYPKRCSNRLMFHEDKGECDWEDQVDCKGKEKLIETSGLQDESKPETGGDGKGRVTKFCMTKENGNYADLYYCNVYHNCHGGFDTVQYCANGLVWRQDSSFGGTCDWPVNSKIVNGVECGDKKIFLIDKQSQVDIMATLRSDFCITRGEGLFSHTKYCDLYIHCTAQAVAITMECAPGLIFNEKKSECDYLADDQLESVFSSICPAPKQVLRPKPKADGTLMFNGNDVTGKFPTKFTCAQKSQQLIHNDDDWCNIYHVCAGPRDNIFICPPGTVFSKQKQGCYERYSSNICSGSVNYYKPVRKPDSNLLASNLENFY